MKRLNKLLVIFAAFALAFVMPTMVSYAGEISGISAEEQNGTITVSGHADSSVLAVVVSVYDGDSLVTFTSSGVDDEHNFSTTIDVAEGNYTVKVADYAGGDWVSQDVSVSLSGAAANLRKSPETGDTSNLALRIIMLGLGGGTIGFAVFSAKRAH